jgi:predicted N-acetyltransferase YhbS
LKESQPLTSSPDFVIRAPETPVELENFFRLAAQTFSRDIDVERSIAIRQRFYAATPASHPCHLRAAFLGNTYVGGYVLFDQYMTLGTARVRTACIASVVTHPDYRHRGIANALLRDAFSLAQRAHYGLLLLHGIPHFYHQFGYSDVLEDMPAHVIDRTRLHDQLPEPSASTYTIRPATLADAPTLLALYQDHYGSYYGNFAATRTLEKQIQLMQRWFDQGEVRIALACDANNEAQGYLMLVHRQGRILHREVAVTGWPALLALLRYHLHLLDIETAPEPRQELWWQLPPTGAIFYMLADHLTLRSQAYYEPDEGWMARPADLAALLQSLLPLWRTRWQHSMASWTGILELHIDNHSYFLDLQPMHVRLIEQPPIVEHTVTLSQQIFTQLLFGFRPISWATREPGQRIPTELLPILDILFPRTEAWIAPSDEF